jgi:hypothetical protein
VAGPLRLVAGVQGLIRLYTRLPCSYTPSTLHRSPVPDSLFFFAVPYTLMLRRTKHGRFIVPIQWIAELRVLWRRGVRHRPGKFLFGHGCAIKDKEGYWKGYWMRDQLMGEFYKEWARTHRG